MLQFGNVFFSEIIIQKFTSYTFGSYILHTCIYMITYIHISKSNCGSFSIIQENVYSVEILTGMSI